MQTRPQLVSPRAAQTLDMVRSVAGGFDVDAWHVMDQRDNALIADEVMYGSASDKFVYHFKISGTEVSGISVIGARHLANHYRGLKHRLVGSVQKTGALFEYRAFPYENFAGDTRVSVVPELENEPDFYSCLCEVTDLKTGNSLQVEAREEKIGHGERGDYEKPHYQKIAQSKAYRNAVLALIPQDVAIRWKAEMLRLKKDEFIAAGVIDEKRSGVLRFAAEQGIAIERRAVEELTLDQIAGLGDAARSRQLPAFVAAAQSLGLVTMQAVEGAKVEASTPQQDQPARRRGRPPRSGASGPGGPDQPADVSRETPASPPPPPAAASDQSDGPRPRVAFD